MNNKRLGTQFEQKLCEIMARHGFWVHFISPDSRGTQPFDIIAVKDGEAFAIECKTLASKEKWFPLSRLEENQLMAFEKWLACGNRHAYIAVFYRGKTRFIPYVQLRDEKKVSMEN